MSRWLSRAGCKEAGGEVDGRVEDMSSGFVLLMH